MKASVGALLDGTLAGSEATAFLSMQNLDRLKPEELAGAADAVMERAVPFPEFPNAIDCCGTGGDARGTYNISTAAAFVAAARGIVVAKHGNRAITSKSGSADVLEALGINTALAPARCADILREVGICFLFAPIFHPGFAKVADVRKAVGKRTIFNLLGPLCNPARVKRQLIGTFAAEHTSLMAEAAGLLGRDEVMAVHGDDGTDEISITGPSHIAHWHQGRIDYSIIRPQDAGLTPHPGRTLIGGDATQNARALLDVLDGQESPYADAVAINAAALLQLAGMVPTLDAGVALARATLARGTARDKLEQLIEASHT